MRKIIVLLVLLALIFCGYWFGVRFAVGEAGRALEQNPSMLQGAEVETAAVRTRGFPNAFAIDIDRPILRTESPRITWSAEALKARTQSYYPFEWSLDISPRHEVQIGGHVVTLETHRFEATASILPRLSLPLRFAEVNLGSAMASLPFDLEAGLGRALLSLERQAPGQYAITGHILDLAIQGPGVPAFLHSVNDTLVASLEAVEGQIGFSSDLDRSVFAGQGARVTSLKLDQAHFSWGYTFATLDAALTIDDAGLADGTGSLLIENWKPLMSAAMDAGLLNQGSEDFVVNFLEQLSRESGGVDVLRIPLNVEDGVVRFGTMTLFSIPRF